MKKRIILIIGTISALILILIGYNKKRQEQQIVNLYGVVPDLSSEQYNISLYSYLNKKITLDNFKNLKSILKENFSINVEQSYEQLTDNMKKDIYMEPYKYIEFDDIGIKNDPLNNNEKVDNEDVGKIVGVRFYTLNENNEKEDVLIAVVEGY